MLKLCLYCMNMCIYFNLQLMYIYVFILNKCKLLAVTTVPGEEGHTQYVTIQHVLPT